MKTKIPFIGRSLPINILLIAFNILGIVLIVMSYHAAFEMSASTLKITGFSILLLSIVGIVAFKGFQMMGAFARVVVGGLFIVSGLIKANDPIGFAYKLEEYFQDGALAYRIKGWLSWPSFSMEYFIDYALFFSVVICILEILLGVLLIIGAMSRFVAWLMLLMMVFFTFLTWHTANCVSSTKFLDRNTFALNDPAEKELATIKLEEAKNNPDIKIVSKDSKEIVVDEMKSPQCVTDCGCFGDAMKGSVGRSLTPTESMWKDLVVLYLVIWILIVCGRVYPNTGKENLYFVTGSMLVVVFLSWVFGWYFPIFFALFCITGAIWIAKSPSKFFGNYGFASLFVIFVSSIIIGYVLMYDPIKDYRPYYKGSNLKEKMNDSDAGVSENHMYYKNKKNGKIKIFKTNEEYMASKVWEDTLNYGYDTMIVKVIRPSKLASITEQFGPFISISDIGKPEKELSFVKDKLSGAVKPGYLVKSLEYNENMEVAAEEYDTISYPSNEYAVVDTLDIMDPNMSEINIRDFIINAPNIVILSVKDLKSADWKTIKNIKSIFEGCKKNNIPFVMICNASREEINEFRERFDLDIPAFVNDEIELKAISRSNPAILYIKNGVVMEKFPFRMIPKYEGLNIKISK